MSIDINKIIQESIEKSLEKESKVETLEESETPIRESFDPAIASAISAGLGALTFRNRIRSLNEQTNRRADQDSLGRRGRIAAGLGIAGTLAGAGLYDIGRAAEDGDSEGVIDNIRRGAGVVGRGIRDRLSDRFTGGTGGTGDQQPTSSDIQQPDRSHDPQVTSGTPKPDPVAQGTAVDRGTSKVAELKRNPRPADERGFISDPDEHHKDLFRTQIPDTRELARKRREAGGFRPGMSAQEISQRAGIAPEIPARARPLDAERRW